MPSVVTVLAIVLRPRLVTRCTDTSLTKSAAFKSAAMPRRARGRQHVIRADRIVAGHLRRPAADEDGAGIGDAAGEGFGSDDHVFGRGAVREIDRFIGASAHDDTAVAGDGVLAGPPAGICRSTSVATRSASARLVVIITARASGSCSACASRSAAIQPRLTRRR